MVEAHLVVAPTHPAPAQVRATVVHRQPVDLPAHLQVVRTLDDRQMVADLLVVGVVVLTAVVDVVEAQVGIAVLVGVELAARARDDVERPDAEGRHVEAFVAGAGTEAAPVELLEAEPELVDHVLVERMDPLRGDVVGVLPPGRHEVRVQGRVHPIAFRDRKPSEDAVGIAEVVIDFREVLIHGQRPDQSLAAREVQGVRLAEVGPRHHRQDVVPDSGMDAVRRDGVVGEGFAGERVVDQDGLAHPAPGTRRGRHQLREVAPAKRIVGIEAFRHTLRPLAAPVPGEHPERLVLDDGTAHDEAELIADALVDLAALVGGPLEVQEVGLGVQGVVAQELVERAVQLVRAALERDVRYGAAAEAGLRREGAGLELELLDRLDGGHERCDRAAYVGGVGAVEADHLVKLAHAIGAHRKAALGDVTAVAPIHARALSELYARHQDRQLDDVAAIERQLDDLPVFDHAADRRVLGVERDRVGGDFDGFGNVADLHREVGSNLRGGFHADPAHRLCLEAVQLTADGVVAHRHVREAVIAGFVRSHGGRNTRVHVRHGHRRAGDDRAGGVRYQTLNGLSRAALRVQGERHQPQQHNESYQREKLCLSIGCNHVVFLRRKVRSLARGQCPLPAARIVRYGAAEQTAPKKI